MLWSEAAARYQRLDMLDCIFAKAECCEISVVSWYRVLEERSCYPLIFLFVLS